MKELKYKIDSPLGGGQYKWVVSGEFLTAAPEEQKTKPIGVYNRTSSQLAENIEILDDNIQEISLTLGEFAEDTVNQVAINTNEIYNISTGILKQIEDVKDPAFTKEFVKYISLEAYDISTSIVQTNNFIQTNALIENSKLILEPGRYKADIIVQSNEIYKDSFLFVVDAADLEVEFSFSKDVFAKYIKIELWRINL